MAKEIITLFIEDTDIRVLVLRGKEVRKWARSPLEPGLVSDGVVLDEAEVAARVRELFEQQKIGGRQVIAALSGLNCLYRIISLPELPEAILDEAVKREAERLIPVSSDEFYLSYQPIPAMRGETRLFLVAIPRNSVDTMIRTIQQSGFDPYLMDLASLALCRTIDQSQAIFIDARPTNFDIVVLADRLPQVIRTLPLPGEAESLAERLPIIREELDRTVTFYNSSHLETPISSDVPLFVCGDLADVPETWESLASRWGFPVSLLPWEESPEGFVPSEYMVNIGLANKELLSEKFGASFSVVNLNVLPKVYQPKRRPLSQYLVPAGIAAGIVLIISLAMLVQASAGRTADMRSELAATEQRITQSRADTERFKEETAVLEEKVVQLDEQLEQVRQRVGEVEAKESLFAATFDGLGRQRTEFNEDLQEITRPLPGTAIFTQISHHDSAAVEGLTDYEDDIFIYARALRVRFSEVLISAIEKQEEDGEMDYIFRLLLKN